MRRNNNLILLVVGGLALWLGYMFRSKQSAVKSAASEIAVNEAKEYVSGEAQVTKNYFSSLGNYWKQVWK